MAERTIEPEVHSALQCIENNQNFILTGGAGSGKTYSLISLIEEISVRYPTKSISCITYTNNAVAEIRSRISNEYLWVSTIHEFIWHVISKFQAEIRETITELVNDTTAKTDLFKKPKGFDEGIAFEVEFFNNKNILYEEYYSLSSCKESKISHDHILVLAEAMFRKYP
ncbi:MAG: UvrD-helicase domain-containing protein, partial [Oscillospiraceae bacterium]